MTPGGRPGCNLRDARLDGVDHVLGVDAGPRDDDAADGFLRALHQRRDAERIADLHVGHLLDVHRARRSTPPMTIRLTSSTDSIRPTPRTISQAPFDSRTLPPTLRLLSRTAETTALSGRL